MYAFQLPAGIPPAGTPDGPPLPENYSKFGGIPLPGDGRLMFLGPIRDPLLLQSTWDRLIALGPQRQKPNSTATK